MLHSHSPIQALEWEAQALAAARGNGGRFGNRREKRRPARRVSKCEEYNRSTHWHTGHWEQLGEMTRLYQESQEAVEISVGGPCAPGRIVGRTSGGAWDHCRARRPNSSQHSYTISDPYIHNSRRTSGGGQAACQARNASALGMRGEAGRAEGGDLWKQATGSSWRVGRSDMRKTRLQKNKERGRLSQSNRFENNETRNSGTEPQF